MNLLKTRLKIDFHRFAPIFNFQFSIFNCLLFLFLSGNLLAQDKASIMLDLRKARANYEVAKQQFENDTRLYDENAISTNDFTRSKNELLSSEVDYQKLILQLISQQSYIVIDRAVKYQTADGSRRVKVTLKNTLEGNEEYLNQFHEHFDVFTPEMRAGKVYNIFVSLLDIADQTIIGTPYEYQISSIETGGEASADFELLKDVETLRVSLNYSGRKDDKNIFLKLDASMNVIDISSMQFSQEADIGSSSVYGLNLERFSTSDDTYRLMVAGLPQQITHEFVDENVRVSQIRFAQGVNTKRLSLRVFLPDREDEHMRIDQPIQFHVLTFTNEQHSQIAGRDITPERLIEMACGVETLELLPRGRGRIEVRATSLYHQISTGDSVTMNITVRNAGTRRLDNIRVTTDHPLGWRTRISPDLIRSLEPDRDATVQISIIPPKDGGVGAQEVKIKTEALADNRRVDTEDRTVRIQVNAKTSVFATMMLLLALIGIIVGLVWFGIKLSRR